jgi:hypothetical protein
MREKRQDIRVKVNGRYVIGRLMFARKVEIDDISINGVSLRADRRMEIGRLYQLKLESRNKVFRVSGVVIWSRLNEISKTPAGEIALIYEAGIRFRDTADRGMIGELIDFIRTGS